MTQDESPSKIGLVKDVLEILGKLLLGLVAICYALGLIVMNSYFSNYGVYSLSLFRLSYVMAGLWALGPVITLVCFTLLGAWLRSEYTVRPPLKRRRFLIVTVLGSILVLAAFIYVLTSLRGPIDYVGLSLTNFALGLLLDGLLAILFLYMLYSESFEVERRLTFISLFIAIFIIVLLTHAVVFGRKVYGAIPPYWGGGMPIQVRIAVESEDKAQEMLKATGISFEGDSHLSNSIEYLFATEDEYIFLVPDGKERKNTVSLSRDTVKGIVYETSLR
jgi:hypothetical protein